MFATETEAKNFAKMKFDEGLIVTAGTINPYTPRQAIASINMLDWLGLEQEQETRGDPHGAQESGER
jgi:hypothetical protein